MNQKNKKPNIHKPWGQLGRALLNNMIGDYLEREDNPLAIKMGFYHQLNKLPLDDLLAYRLDTPLSNKVVILIHGESNIETEWNYPSKRKVSQQEHIDNYIEGCFQVKNTHAENYGYKLHNEFGHTPLFLRYNTGLSPEKNGRELAAQLKILTENYPIEIEELMMIGYSKGGKLIQQAHNYAQQHNKSWLNVLTRCIYLGTKNESTWRKSTTRLRLSSQKSKAISTNTPVHYFISSDPRLDQNKTAIEHNHQNKASETLLCAANSALSITTHFEHLSFGSLQHSDRIYAQISQWVKRDLQKESSIYLACFIPADYDDVSKDIADSLKNSSENAGQIFIAGLIDFAASTYDKTLELVETTHYSVAEEPFYVLQKYPLVSQIAAPIEQLHRNVLNVAYRSLRQGGRWLHKTAKTVFHEEGSTPNERLPLLAG